MVGWRNRCIERQFRQLRFVFGGTVGADFQAGSLVLGVEADGDSAGSSGSGTITGASICAGGCLTKNTWLATVRGRAGYAFHRFLVYGTGGAAFGKCPGALGERAREQHKRSRWMVGAGVEVALDPYWSAKAEYLFVDLGNGSCTIDCAIENPNGPPLIPNVTVKFNESVFRAGIDYKLVPN